MYRWSNQERIEFARSLAPYHAVFYRFFQMAAPLFIKSRSCPTAMVCFDRKGRNYDFVINQDFWETLTDTQKKFVVCHEVLHVMLDHARRSVGLNHKKANQTQDISINESLVEAFGFDQEEVDPQGDYCWTSTLFPDEPNIPKDQCFEYYYNKLPEKFDLRKLLGNHIQPDEGPPGEGEGEEGATDEKEKEEEEFDPDQFSWSPEDMDDLQKEVTKELTEEEKEALQDTLNKQDKGSPSRGIDKGGLTVKVVDAKQRDEQHWIKVIKRWTSKRLNLAKYLMWFGKPKRYSLIEDVKLPHEIENEKLKKDKENVWLFLDTSGSCWHMRDIFFKAARSIPSTHFNVRLFSFDTDVFELDLKQNEVKGGGGTSFQVIDHYVNQQVQSGEKYPTIFMITDGYGDRISPLKSEKWHVFLVQNSSEVCFTNSKISIHKFNHEDYN